MKVFNQVSAVVEKVNDEWSYLGVNLPVTPRMDRQIELKKQQQQQNVGLLKRMQDKVKEETPDQDTLLHCLVHQESL